MACLKCGGTMEDGHMPDAGYGGYVMPGWFPGLPERSFWRGLKVDEKQRTPVIAQRCTACGFLELYAKPI